MRTDSVDKQFLTTAGAPGPGSLPNVALTLDWLRDDFRRSTSSQGCARAADLIEHLTSRLAVAEELAATYEALKAALERYTPLDHAAMTAIHLPGDVVSDTKARMAYARNVEAAAVAYYRAQVSAALAQAEQPTVAVQTAWEWAGGNPGIKATAEELKVALQELDKACDEKAEPAEQAQPELCMCARSTFPRCERWRRSCSAARTASVALRHNVAGNRLARQGQSELTGVLGPVVEKRGDGDE